MNVREKLVELLWEYDQMRMMRMSIEECVGRLVPKGVTVQEWISVEDGLPKDSATVNLCTRSKIVGTGFYNKYTKSWVQYYSGGSISVDVTHWMPMPNLPATEGTK